MADAPIPGLSVGDGLEQQQSIGEAGSFRCLVEQRVEVGAGKAKFIEYHAQAVAYGQPPMQLRFRFRELVALRGQLAADAQLKDVQIPRLPPKVTLKTLTGQKFDEAFQAERYEQVQRWIEDLTTVLRAKFSSAGNFSELCQPFAAFVQKAGQRGTAAETAAVAEALRVAEVAEDRNIIDTQNAEFEESARIDRIREEEQRAAERTAREAAERQEALAREEAERTEELRRKAEEQAQSREQDAVRRRADFEANHPAPAQGQPQAKIQLRARSGATTQRAFARSAPVAALFDFAELVDWDGAPKRGFDLRMTFPQKSLRDVKEQSLEEAGLAPSAALIVAEDEEDD